MPVFEQVVEEAADLVGFVAPAFTDGEIPWPVLPVCHDSSGLAREVVFKNLDGGGGCNPIEPAVLAALPNDFDGILWGWDWGVIWNNPRAVLDQTGKFAGIFNCV
jgi:hypothetical protein